MDCVISIVALLACNHPRCQSAPCGTHTDKQECLMARTSLSETSRAVYQFLQNSPTGQGTSRELLDTLPDVSAQELKEALWQLRYNVKEEDFGSELRITLTAEPSPSQLTDRCVVGPVKPGIHEVVVTKNSDEFVRDLMLQNKRRNQIAEKSTVIGDSPLSSTPWIMLGCGRTHDDGLCYLRDFLGIDDMLILRRWDAAWRFVQTLPGVRHEPAS